MMRERQDRVAGERVNGAAVPAQDGRREASDNHTSRPVANAGDWDNWESWNERSRIVLSPVAAPSILGLFGFAGATFMVASLLAGWWGSPATASPVIAPFALFFGVLAQLLAGMWSYRARDGVATAMHGTWGSFWLGWGLLVLLTAGGILPTSVLTSRAFGFWFIVLAVVTTFGALAALGDSLGLLCVCQPPGFGSAVRSPLAGPGSDLSEELAVGVEPVALDVRAAPECPPGPAAACRSSAIMSRQTWSARRRFKQRIASLWVLPVEILAS